MQKFLRLFLLLGFSVLPVMAQNVRDIGPIDVNADSKTIPVRVSANTPELNALANQAFKSHGRYRLADGSPAYDIKFALVAPKQVRVDVTKGAAGAPVLSQTVTGTSDRNALLRAADLVVEKTNGAGLKGFFTARLAFISERTGKSEVYTSDLFCGEVKQVTNDNASALMPRWSPDGTKIIYTSYYKSGFPDIYLINLTVPHRETYMSVKGTNQGARFSPNGRQVAMVLSGTGTPEIWIGDASGLGKPVRKTQSDFVKSSPCFSPDGTRLVFSSEPGPQLYVMSVNGGEMRKVTTGSYCAEPDWSRANPNKIAYTIREGGRYQIAVLDLTSGKSEKVSNAPFDGIEPSWLPDGRHVVYTARDRTTSVLRILDTETGASSAPISGKDLRSCLQASVWAP